MTVVITLRSSSITYGVITPAYIVFLISNCWLSSPSAFGAPVFIIALLMKKKIEGSFTPVSYYLAGSGADTFCLFSSSSLSYVSGDGEAARASSSCFSSPSNTF